MTENVLDIFLGVLAIILLPVLSGLMIGKPEGLWKPDHILTVKGGESTAFYLGVTRLCGVLLLVCWLVMLIWLVMSSVLG